jgi:NadR type nicotinamide-nucleotide adenylyltransferase
VNGLVMGKFYPPHAGHHALIRRAASECDRVVVVVVASAAETIPVADRVAWLAAEHAGEGNVRIVGARCDAPLDVTDDVVWRAHVAVVAAAARVGGAPVVDVVYSGEEYGTELAARLGAKHVRVERDGRSSTAVRRDLAGMWDDLAPATRAGLTTRVVVLGAESTGTTTVAAKLAERFRARGGAWTRTECVPEYGREYTQLKWAREGGALDALVWDVHDFDTVAAEQTRAEDGAARRGSPVLIGDTDAFATAIWERRYLGAAVRLGQPWAERPASNLYLLTDHEDVPWHDDGLREGDLAIRAAMTGWFADALTQAQHSWALLTGSLDERVDLAVRTVDQVLARRLAFTVPFTGPGFARQAR